MKHMTAHRFASKSGQTFKWVTMVCIPQKCIRHHLITDVYTTTLPIHMLDLDFNDLLFKGIHNSIEK